MSGEAGRIARRFAEIRAAGRLGLVAYITAGDPDLERTAAFIPALESAHAVAEALRRAPAARGQIFVLNISGRGDKDMEILERELAL